MADLMDYPKVIEFQAALDAVLAYVESGAGDPAEVRRAGWICEGYCLSVEASSPPAAATGAPPATSALTKAEKVAALKAAHAHVAGTSFAASAGFDWASLIILLQTILNALRPPTPPPAH